MHRSLVRASSIRFRDNVPNVPSNSETVGCTCGCRGEDPSSKVEEDSCFGRPNCQRSPFFLPLDILVADDTEATDETEAAIREVTPAKTPVSELLSRVEQLHSCDPSVLEKAQDRASLLQRSLSDEQRQEDGADLHEKICHSPVTPSYRRQSLTDRLKPEAPTLDLNALLDRINLEDVVAISEPQHKQSAGYRTHRVSNSLLSEISRALSVSSADYDCTMDNGDLSSFDLELDCNEDASCASSVTWDDGEDTVDDLSTLSDLDDILLGFEHTGLEDL